MNSARNGKRIAVAYGDAEILDAVSGIIARVVFVINKGVEFFSKIFAEIYELLLILRFEDCLELSGCSFDKSFFFGRS